MCHEWWITFSFFFHLWFDEFCIILRWPKQLTGHEMWLNYLLSTKKIWLTIPGSGRQYQCMAHLHLKICIMSANLVSLFKPVFSLKSFSCISSPNLCSNWFFSSESFSCISSSSFCSNQLRSGLFSVFPVLPSVQTGFIQLFRLHFSPPVCRQSPGSWGGGCSVALCRPFPAVAAASSLVPPSMQCATTQPADWHTWAQNHVPQSTHKALEICNTSTTTKTWVTHSNSHLACV